MARYRGSPSPAWRIRLYYVHTGNGLTMAIAIVSDAGGDRLPGHSPASVLLFRHILDSWFFAIAYQLLRMTAASIVDFVVDVNPQFIWESTLLLKAATRR